MAVQETDRRSGFTLIEVLVALVILGLAMGVVVSGLHSAANGAARTSEQAEALAVARSLLAAEGTTVPLVYGETSGDTADGFDWTVSVKPWTADGGNTPLLGAYWINVRVAHAGRSLELTTLRPGPAPNAE